MQLINTTAIHLFFLGETFGYKCAAFYVIVFIMNYFKDFVQSVGTHKLASEQLGVSRAYVTQILLGRKKVSFKVAKRVESLTSGRITRKDLRPDIYG